MNESNREQYPLLCEDLSEEECYSPLYHNRRPMSYKNRARYHVKGAAAILRRWPDHWSAFLVYWWIGIGMICVTTFILYNSLFGFSLLPFAYLKPAKSSFAISPLKNEPSDKSLTTEIYMHTFYLPNEEIDLNKYIPYIEAISFKYPNFKYNLMVVINDTYSFAESNEMNAEEVNEMALNTLWSKDVTYGKKLSSLKNININYVTLSKYMDNSPVAKYWRDLTNEVVEFLLRTLSIWNKGGIVFNPSIIIPGALNEAYSEKLFNIFHKFHNSNDIRKAKNFKHITTKNKFKKRVNNIHDIIEALEHEDGISNDTQEPLTAAENLEFKTVAGHSRKILSYSVEQNESRKNTSELEKSVVESGSSKYGDQRKKMKNDSLKHYNWETHKFNMTNNLGILPSFLEYLFHGNPYNRGTEETPILQLEVTTKDKENKIEGQIITTEAERTVSSLDGRNTIIEKSNNNKTLTTINHIQEDESEIRTSHGTKELTNVPNENKNSLIIDLKGNIIATGTPCHVFLGTLYTNAIHYPKPEIITNFLISELSIFCKGLLSSCVGIDILLL